MKTLDKLLKSKHYKFDEQGMIHFVLSSFYNPNPVLPGKNFPSSYAMPCLDSIFDEDTQSVKKIRYILGEPSIFAEEQSDPSPAADKHVASIYFKNGFVSLRKEEKTALHYLMLSNNNRLKEHRMPNKEGLYEVWQKDIHKEEAVDNDELITMAKMKLIEMCKSEDGLNNIKSFAMVWGINIKQEIAGIKHDLNFRIAKDPQGFLNGLEDKNMKRKYYIMQAIQDKIIDKDDANNTIKWNSTGGTILVAPIGIDLIDYFVEKSFNDLEQSYDMIKEKVLEQLSFKSAIKKQDEEKEKVNAEKELAGNTQREERKAAGLAAPAFKKKEKQN